MTAQGAAATFGENGKNRRGLVQPSQCRMCIFGRARADPWLRRQVIWRKTPLLGPPCRLVRWSGGSGAEAENGGDFFLVAHGELNGLQNLSFAGFMVM